LSKRKGEHGKTRSLFPKVEMEDERVKSLEEKNWDNEEKNEEGDRVKRAHA